MKLALALFLLVLVVPLFAEEEAVQAPTDSKVVVLKPLKVQGTATGDFAIDVRIIVDGQTKKVRQMLITRVTEHSDAAALGLQAGDEILKIDGVPVAGMDSTIAKDSQLGKIFLNREPGDTLKLEVAMNRTRTITLHATGALH
jgi:C-terminal processing protease CtpA/Prc